jgi:hypothetical protein
MKGLYDLFCKIISISWYNIIKKYGTRGQIYVDECQGWEDYCSMWF